MPRDEIVNAQRIRIVLAMADAMHEKGYVGTPVADILKRAGFRLRETFYQLFSSKLDCYLAAFDLVGEAFLIQLRAVRSRNRGRRWTGSSAGSPPISKPWHRSRPTPACSWSSAMPPVPKPWHVGRTSNAGLTEAMAELLGATTEADRFSVQMFVSAVSGLVTGPLVAHDTDALRRLGPTAPGTRPTANDSVHSMCRGRTPMSSSVAFLGAGVGDPPSVGSRHCSGGCRRADNRTAPGAPTLQDGDGLHLIAQQQVDQRLMALTFTTSALAHPVSVRVLLPADYGADPNLHYPVLYLFDGTSGHASGLDHVGEAEQTTAGLPLIVVMPDITLQRERWGLVHQLGQRRQVRHNPNGRPFTSTS